MAGALMTGEVAIKEKYLLKLKKLIEELVFFVDLENEEIEEDNEEGYPEDPDADPWDNWEAKEGLKELY